MSPVACVDEDFLSTLQGLLGGQPEILVLIRFSRAAGSKSFEFFSAFAALSERLRGLPPQTSVIAFRTPQLPLRGVVGNEFIVRCLNEIAEGTEYLVVGTDKSTSCGEASFYHWAGVSHAELRECLQNLRGKQVAVGLYPPWLAQSGDVISAIVPGEHGVASPGRY